MRELINRNKFKIILATIAMLIPTLVGYFVFDRILYLPIGLALLYIFVVLITFYSWRNKNQTDTAVNLLIYFFPALGLFVSFMHLLILEGGYSNPGLVFRVITAGLRLYL